MRNLWLILFMLAAANSYAQDVDSFVELLRSDIKTQKKAVITEVMQFNEEESAAFWPVYREFEFENDKLGDARVALIKDYAAHFEMMTDAKAKELTEKSFKLQEDRLRLRKKYFKEISKVLSSIQAAKFMQLENQIGLLIDLQIASELPLVEEPETEEN